MSCIIEQKSGYTGANDRREEFIPVALSLESLPRKSVRPQASPCDRVWYFVAHLVFFKFHSPISNRSHFDELLELAPPIFADSSRERQKPTKNFEPGFLVMRAIAITMIGCEGSTRHSSSTRPWNPRQREPSALTDDVDKMRGCTCAVNRSKFARQFSSALRNNEVSLKDDFWDFKRPHNDFYQSHCAPYALGVQFSSKEAKRSSGSQNLDAIALTAITGVTESTLGISFRNLGVVITVSI
ncbi:5113_t:CDS:2 [Acaulospora colombiana]|uniref:5113_t:CDS:1 n=1 Tax=Acaulospora colombiana TaxID=27376 RepID=A0ACA9KI08_9GLOM|nr:5113_t:CDS:2 [Acaulospora colombiana]